MRVRNEHWQLLLSFCEDHRELITNKFKGTDGKARANQLWQNLCKQLNSLGFGEKSITEWRKTLIDWKSKTKSKAAKINREIQKTGGGPPDYIPLTDMEKRLIDLMGKKAIDGDNVEELGFGEVPPLEILTVKPLQLNQSSCSQSGAVEVINLEHDYVEENTSLRSNTSFEKCDLAKEVQTTPVPTRLGKWKRLHDLRNSIPLRSKDRPRLSRQLINLNEESVNVLKTIADNTGSIAESLKSIVAALQFKTNGSEQSVSGENLAT